MNTRRFTIVALCLLLCGQAPAQIQNMEKELSELAEKLSAQIKDQGKKKVTVLDFTDLQGSSSELGRYVSEQLTVNLVLGKKDFSVLDRANLRSILAEHKLTSEGLVDPANAKKLGLFAGVDALILGNMVPMKDHIELTAKVLTTDTAEVVGAARAKFLSDQTVEQLLSRAASQNNTSTSLGSLADDKPKVTKAFGDLRVELLSLKIVNSQEYLLTINLTNQNPRKSIWVAVNQDRAYRVKSHITDSNGTDNFVANEGLSGINAGREVLVYGNASGFANLGDPPHHQFEDALELKPGASTLATIRYKSSASNLPEPGICTIYAEILLGHEFMRGSGTVTIENLITKMEAQSPK